MSRKRLIELEDEAYELPLEQKPMLLRNLARNIGFDLEQGGGEDTASLKMTRSLAEGAEVLWELIEGEQSGR